MMENLAIRYLTRRGWTVLPRTFVGMALGCAAATKVETGLVYTSWRVMIPKDGHLIALNNTMIDKKG